MSAPATSLSSPQAEPWEGAQPRPLLITLLLGLTLWMIPTPAGLSQEAWQLFSIFVATIAGIITKPLPIGPVVMIGMSVAICTGAATFQDIFPSYGSSGVWLVIFSFFLAQGLIKSGLAQRVAYLLVSLFGKSTLGLAGAIIGCELLLAPFVPSLVARSGGIIFPIVTALNQGILKREDGDTSTQRFLTLTIFHSSLICSNLFLTSMAANPLVAGMAADVGISITWNSWAAATLVPGLLSLFTCPFLIYKLAPPKTTQTPQAPLMAQQELKRMGPIRTKEWITTGIFSFVLLLWVFGSQWGIGSAVAAMMGMGLFMATGIFTWQDCLEEKTAWDSFFWLAAIIGMGSTLKGHGFFDWFSHMGIELMGDLSWQWGFLAIALTYFYSHYLFASNIAHASSMFLAFLVACLDMGTPPLLAFFVLASFTNLFGGLTHYSCGAAPLYFGAGYASTQRWWLIGGIICTYNLLILLTVGTLWWRFIGIW